MKHLNQHIIETLFDTDDSDNIVRSEVLSKLFDNKKFTVSLDGNTLVIDDHTYINVAEIDSDNLKKIISIAPDVDSIRTNGYIEFFGCNNFDRYIRLIEAETIIIDNIPGLDGCTLNADNGIEIYRLISSSNCNLNTNSGSSTIGEISFSCAKPSSDRNHLDIYNLSTNSKAININGYSHCTITSKSRDLKTVHFHGEEGMGPKGCIFKSLTTNITLAKFRPGSVRDIMQQFGVRQRLLEKMNPAKELGIDKISNLDFIEWDTPYRVNSSIYCYAPQAATDPAKVRIIRDLNYNFDCADGWKIGISNIK